MTIKRSRAELFSYLGARIKELNTDEVFAAGELYEDETGNVWIERVARVPLGEVRVPRGTPRRGTD